MTKTIRSLLFIAVATSCASCVGAGSDSPTKKQKPAQAAPNDAAAVARQQAAEAAARMRNMPRTVEEFEKSLTPDQRAAIERTMLALGRHSTPTAPATAPATSAAATSPAAVAAGSGARHAADVISAQQAGR